MHLGERPLYLYLARDMRTKARPTTLSERGRTAKWSSGWRMRWRESWRRSMSGSLEQFAGLVEKEEEEESGSSVHCSENGLREYSR